MPAWERNLQEAGGNEQSNGTEPWNVGNWGKHQL